MAKYKFTMSLTSRPPQLLDPFNTELLLLTANAQSLVNPQQNILQL